MSVRVRFAPSPTGALHLGNARTALFNWRFARKMGGRFVLRIEDTDLDRSLKKFEAEQMAMLRWLGLDWDEGPNEAGERGPYRQSERRAIYHQYAQELLRAGRAYACYCTDKELEAERRAALARGRPPRYSGRCRDLSPEQKAALESEGRRPALRFKVGAERISFSDLIHGPVEFRAQEIGDFIIVRQTGSPAYNFACVIDDHLMDISHVIRGQDHLANTPRQMMIYRFFGWEPPLFAHHSLLVGADKAKLSKRHGATRVAQMINMGFLPEALVNYLAYIGGGLGRVADEVMTLKELGAAFDLSRLGRAPAVFDHLKLKWFNTQHLRRMAPEALIDRLMEWWRGEQGRRGPEGWLWRDDLVCQNRPRLEKAAALARENATNLEELTEWMAILTWEVADNENQDALYWPANVLAELTSLGAEGRQVLEAASEMLDQPDWLTRLPAATGLKGRRLYHPLRLALTGRDKGPQLADLVSFLTENQMRRRLKNALDLISGRGA